MSKKKLSNIHKIPSGQIDQAEAEIQERSRRIDFYMTEYTVELLVEKMNRQEFVIPEYQREFTWEDTRKSRFIESLIMGLPIPFLFFWEMNDGRLEIIDGSQRLRTLQEYVSRSLVLTELETLPSLTGTCFKDLSTSRQRKIKNRSIRGIVLNEHADAQARFDMFERINTGSKMANTAEVRRGALRGPFQSMVEDLAKVPLFTHLAPVSVKSKKERIPEEMVARFFAYGDGLESYKDSPSRFIFEYTRSMNQRFLESGDLSSEYRQRFEIMLAFVQRTFPNGFRKQASSNSTPRARFEAIAIGSYLAMLERPSIATPPPDISDWIDSPGFAEITTSDSANVKSKLQGRIQFVKRALLGEPNE